MLMTHNIPPAQQPVEEQPQGLVEQQRFGNEEYRQPTAPIPLLDCQGLTKRYGSNPALQSINLQIYPGRITGLLGANGSGKTTLMKLAAGVLTPTTGEIYINGENPGVESKKIVSYLPERTYLPDWMRARDAVSFFSEFYQDFNSEKAIDMMLRLGVSPDARMRSLSKGNREKVQIILVMSRAAQLYLLDEPIGGVDPAARDFILQTIIGEYQPHAAILISTHLIHDVEKILDQVIFINNGHIALEAAVDDIREHEGKSVDEFFREVFRC